MDIAKYFSGYNLKNVGRKQKFEYAKNVQFGLECLTLRPVAYMAVDFKKFVSDLFHDGSAMLESESIKRKTRLSE